VLENFVLLIANCDANDSFTIKLKVLLPRQSSKKGKNGRKPQNQKKVKEKQKKGAMKKKKNQLCGGQRTKTMKFL